MSMILSEVGQVVLGVVMYALTVFAIGWTFGIGFTLGQEIVYGRQSKEDEANA